MMKKFNLLMLVFFVSFYGFSQAGDIAMNDAVQPTNKLSYKLNSSGSNFTIKGTSSLHDWEMISKSFSGKLDFDHVTDGDLKIHNIEVKVGVKTLESGKRVMDNKCYDALKSDSHPSITYRLNKVESIQHTGSDNYTAKLIGTLSIAGKTRTVTIDTKIAVVGGKVIIKGEKPLKMSDFDVEPPTALLGTLKTGNDIIIDFNLNYN
ncbi:YceI family protein [Pukyongia salina]|nr:YceI family protein [Pukyongia salina]